MIEAEDGVGSRCLAVAAGLVALLGAGAAGAVQRVAVYPVTPDSGDAAGRISTEVMELHDVVLESGASVQQALVPCGQEARCALKRARDLGLDLVLMVWARPISGGTVEVEPTVVDVGLGKVEAFKSDFWQPSDLHVAALHTAMRVFRPQQVVGGVMIDGAPEGAVVTVDGVECGARPFLEPVGNLDERIEHAVEVKGPKGRVTTKLYVTFHKVTHLKPEWPRHALAVSRTSELNIVDLAPLEPPTHRRTVEAAAMGSAPSPADAAPSTPEKAASGVTAPGSSEGVNGLRIAGFALAGVGAAALGGGIYEGVQNRTAKQEYENFKKRYDSGEHALAGQVNTASDRVRQTGTAANVLFIAGGATAVAGAVLFWLSGREGAPRAEVAWIAGRPGISFSGAF